jgi:hypothetical protein
MKKLFLLTAVFATAASSYSATWSFDLTGVAGSGLRSGNEIGVPNDSTATGKELTDLNPLGIFYEDSTGVLTLNLGWGSAGGIGENNLTADFSGAHIHGPADINTGNAPIIFTLASDSTQLSFSDNNGRSGSFDNRTVTLVGGVGGTQHIQLTSGLWYINVHSLGTYAAGEIRGQLTPVPEPSTYAAIFGFGLMAFAAYRRVRLNRAM